MNRIRSADSPAVFLLFCFTTLLSVGVVRAGTVLTAIAPSRVCMVNDTAHSNDQIPVTVDGKIYFGCCEMCKGRLTTDSSVRSAVDPITGKSVDKATATIGALANGKVLYFESQQTFATYQGQP